MKIKTKAILATALTVLACVVVACLFIADPKTFLAIVTSLLIALFAGFGLHQIYLAFVVFFTDKNND